MCRRRRWAHLSVRTAEREIRGSSCLTHCNGSPITPKSLTLRLGRRSADYAAADPQSASDCTTQGDVRRDFSAGISPRLGISGPSANTVLLNSELWPLLIDRHEKRDLLVATLTYLNYFELIAVGIKNDTLDARLYQDWYRTRYIAVWDKAAPFVLKWRDADKPLRKNSFIEFGKLAAAWQRPSAFRRVAGALASVSPARR